MMEEANIKVFERHRHRYEFNNFYRKIMEKEGMITTKPIKVGNRIVKVIVQAKG